MPRVFDSLQDVDISGDTYTSPLPLGPEGLRHGVLKNGITYYVRQCAKPKARAAIGLAVRAGSVLEEDHEQGIAHILEHLAFNATENYSNHDIVKFLERIGAQFGACQNAYTSADETVYQLTVPSDSWQVVEDTLAVVAEWAFRIRCAPEDIAKERGAVLEEWRMSRDAGGRLQEAHWQLVLQGSKYASRLPIGLEKIIRNVPAEVVRGFYRRWYVPSNLAVVMVGDFDCDKVVQAIKQHLDVAPPEGAAAAPAERPRYGFPPHSTPRCRVFTDKEQQDSSVYASFKVDRRPISTPAEFLEHLQVMVFQQALSARLFKIARQQEPPFFAASTSDDSLTSSVDSFVLAAQTLEGGSLEALEALLTEVARIRLHGFSEREIAAAKSDVVAEVETTYMQRDQGYCTDIRDEYIRHFLTGEFVTGQEYEARLCKTLLPRISKSDVEGCADLFHPSNNCVIKVVEHRRRCSEAQLEAVVARVVETEKEGAIAAWEDVEVPDLMEQVPEPGALVSERQYPALGATELLLGNGLRVLIKETEHLEDEVLLTGFARGGLSQVPRGQFTTCSLAQLVAGQLGPYGHKPTIINEILAGKRVDLQLSEGAYARSFKGSQSPDDLETALQLVHQLFATQVTLVPEELATVMKVVRQNTEAQQRNPLFSYHNRVRLVNYGGCYYFEPVTVEDLEAVELQGCCSHHNASYCNPAEFTVVLTGKISRAEIEPLLLRYLASIPPQQQPAPLAVPDVKALPVTFPTSPCVEDVQVDMVSPITQTQITFPVALDPSKAREDVFWLGFVCRLLETRLLQVLRFQFGEIYTVAVSHFFGCEAISNTGPIQGDVSIAFTCDPANRHHLQELALQEVARLQAEPPTAEEVATLVRLEELQWENEQQENGWWHDLLVSFYQGKSYAKEGDLDLVYSKYLQAREAVMKAMAGESMREAARRLFPLPCDSRHTAIAMVPKQPGLLQRAIFALATSSEARMKAAVGLGVLLAAGGVLLVRRALQRADR